MSALTIAISLVMVVITGYYARLTKILVDIARKTFNCQLAPVIGIEVGRIYVDKEYGPGRRGMSIDLTLHNLGNAPAIDVLVDSEIQFRYASIQQHKVIPARFNPSEIPFLKVGDVVCAEPISQSYGNTFITALQDEAREFDRLNTHRISTDPTQESYRMSVLKVYAYYKNAVGQFFKSCYEIEVCVFHPKDVEKECFELTKVYLPRPKFEVVPINEEVQVAEIATRDKKRELCGW